jgi:hypothetical protein
VYLLKIGLLDGPLGPILCNFSFVNFIELLVGNLFLSNKNIFSIPIRSILKKFTSKNYEIEPQSQFYKTSNANKLTLIISLTISVQQKIYLQL